MKTIILCSIKMMVMLYSLGRCSALTSLKAGEEGEGKMKGKNGGPAPVCFGPYAVHYCDI